MELKLRQNLVPETFKKLPKNFELQQENPEWKWESEHMPGGPTNYPKRSPIFFPFIFLCLSDLS